MPRFRPLLNQRHLMFLRATMGRGPAAAEAFQAWRSSEKFEDTDDLAYRVMPLLAATAERAGLHDENTRRMRGVVKHIWLSNMVRIRDLIEAKQVLERGGVPVLLFKGGALFARDPQFAAMRAAGDYDLLVRRVDARRSIDLLRQQGFHSLGLRIELFSEPDFDGDTHAVAMSKADAGKAIDLHWRAISVLRQESLVEDLFASAEASELFGHKVMIPGLAEHLLIAVLRPEPADQQETLLRVIEVTQLLRCCSGRLDWARFVTLVQRYGGAWIAAPLLALARDEADAPMPDGLVDQLWRSGPPGRSLELSICSIGKKHRSAGQKMLLAAVRSMRRRINPFSWTALLANTSAIGDILTDGLAQGQVGRGWVLRRLWRRYVDADRSVGDDQCRFLDGFSVPEPEGRWTDREWAVIEARAPASSGAVAKVTLDVVPFFPPGTQRLTVRLYAGSGQPVAHVISPADTMPVRLELDAAIAGTPGRVVIVLSIPGRVSPYDLGLSVDDRLLGLFVRSIRLDGKSIFTPAGATA